MRSLFAIAVGLVVGLSAGLAAPGKEKEDKDDLKKLEGNWTVTSWKQSGGELEQEQLDTAKWTVKGDKYWFELSGVGEEGTIKVDSSKKTPTIDLTITEGNDKGKEQPGIYKVDGDTITFCFARPGEKDRPTDFKSTEDDGFILIVMKKKK